MAAKYGRFFQLGYVVRDIDAAIAGLQKRMGASLVDVAHDLRDAAGQPRLIENLAHMAVPGAEIELIQPRAGWPSIYEDALPDCAAGVGFHHVGFLVPDLEAWDAALGELAAMRTPIVWQGAYPHVRFAYIDTRRHAGHYSELVWRSPDVVSRPLP